MGEVIIPKPGFVNHGKFLKKKEALLFLVGVTELRLKKRMKHGTPLLVFSHHSFQPRVNVYFLAFQQEKDCLTPQTHTHKS